MTRNFFLRGLLDLSAEAGERSERKPGDVRPRNAVDEMKPLLREDQLPAAGESGTDAQKRQRPELTSSSVAGVGKFPKSIVVAAI